MLEPKEYEIDLAQAGSNLSMPTMEPEGKAVAELLPQSPHGLR